MENLKTSLKRPGYIGKIILKWVLEDNWLMKVSYGIVQICSITVNFLTNYRLFKKDPTTQR
jgi:hypothetical protein